MKCSKCNAEMKLQSSGMTEEVYVCSSSSCPNTVKTATTGYEVAKIAGTVVSTVAVLFGFGAWLGRDS
ncbi:MAG: hypothetical protein ACKV2Q_14700 [Planctomycetaceae bacterium]